jgi:hypothetical protein
MNLKKFRRTFCSLSHFVSTFSTFLLLNHIKLLGLLLWLILDSSHCTYRSPHSPAASQRNSSISPDSLSQDLPVQLTLTARQSFSHDQSNFRYHIQRGGSQQRCWSRNHCWPRVLTKACSSKQHCHQSQPSDRHTRSSC